MKKFFMLVLCLGMLTIQTTALSADIILKSDQNPPWELVSKQTIATSNNFGHNYFYIITEKLVVDHGYIIRTTTVSKSGECSVHQIFVVTNH